MSVFDFPYTRFHSESDNFYSIEDILASQEKVPCKCELTLHRLGFLNPSGDSEDIPAGTKLELPLWLASGLHGKRRAIVSVDLTKEYKERSREILRADARVVDMHKYGPHFYSFGTKLLNFEHRETPDVAATLLDTFINRFLYIMDSSQNASHQDVLKLTQKLDEVELGLFRRGQKSLESFQEWETRKITKIVASEMVASHRKRKRAVMEEDGEEED